MANLDLSKQVGPLPMGAWIVVVGAGLGIAYWSYRNNAGPATVVEDTSGEPGVGVGGTPAGWSDVGPPPTTRPPNPTTNEEWGRLLINELVARGYPATNVDSAVRKYLASEKLSVSENAIIAVGLTLMVTLGYGPPPQTLPPGESPPDGTPPPPPGGQPPATQPPPVGTRVSVPLGKNLYTWTSDVSRIYHIPYSLNIMRALNPLIDRYIDWLPPAPGTTYKIPVFHNRRGGVPPVRIR